MIQRAWGDSQTQLADFVSSDVLMCWISEPSPSFEKEGLSSGFVRTELGVRGKDELRESTSGTFSGLSIVAELKFGTDWLGEMTVTSAPLTI